MALLSALSACSAQKHCLLSDVYHFGKYELSGCTSAALHNRTLDAAALSAALSSDDGVDVMELHLNNVSLNFNVLTSLLTPLATTLRCNHSSLSTTSLGGRVQM